MDVISVVALGITCTALGWTAGYIIGVYHERKLWRWLDNLYKEMHRNNKDIMDRYRLERDNGQNG